MTILINTKFTPFRMSLRKREPVQLYVELANKSGEDKKILFEMTLGNGIALDKAGMRTKTEKKFEPLGAGQKKFFYYQIFPKANIQYGETPITIRLFEPHDEAYEFVRKKYTKEITLTVD